MRKPFLTSGLFGLLTNLPDQHELLEPGHVGARREAGHQLRQALADAATSRAEDVGALATLRRAIETAGSALPTGSAAATRLALLLEQADARAQHDSPTRALQFLAAELAERIADLTFEPIAERPTPPPFAGIDEIEIVAAATADGVGDAMLSIAARGLDSAARVQELRLRLERWLHRAGCEWEACGPLRLCCHNSPAVGVAQRWFQAQIPIRRRAS